MNGSDATGRALDDLDDLFIRCADCGLVAEPTSADALLLPGGGYDFTSGQSTARCAPCGRVQPLTAANVVDDRSAVHPCRCGDTRACPADAARVQCRGCGVFGIGPGARGEHRRAVADKLRITEDLHSLELRSTYQRAKRRAAGLPEIGEEPQ